MAVLLVLLVPLPLLTSDAAVPLGLRWRKELCLGAPDTLCPPPGAGRHLSHLAPHGIPLAESDGRLFVPMLEQRVGLRTGWLAALDGADGRQLWWNETDSSDSGGAPQCTRCLATSGSTLAYSGGWAAMAVDARDGELRWRAPLQVEGSP